MTDVHGTTCSVDDSMNGVGDGASATLRSDLLLSETLFSRL